MKVLALFIVFFSIHSMATEILSLNATYEVPVSEDLKALATHKISDYYIVTTDNGKKSMVYFLPDDLTSGETLIVSMDLNSDVDGVKSFSGPTGTAQCRGKWMDLNCNVNFENLDLKAEKAKEYLELKYGVSAETSKRVYVTEHFSNDPIGVVRTDGIKQ